MKILRHFAFGTLAALFLVSSATMAFAGDPPSRVARLKYISGDVSMQPGGVDDWATATINRPMTTADRLWTDKDSRAELHLGSAAMRLDSETSLTLTNLTDSTVQLQLDQGTLNLQVARLYDGEVYEVDTPNTAFTILKTGNYRFDVDSQGDATLVTVWKGKGVATGNGDAVRVDSRRQVRFVSGMSLAHQTYGEPRLDGFDQWCQVRAEREARVLSVRYVSPDVIGYEDLDEYGAWREVGTYGGVWFPTRIEAGWAPYRYGHWAWIEPWGWTWVDDAAWGFAPFHYGRWVFVTGRWGWVPGPLRVRPCYAPALVAWIGGTSVGVGWFPLGYGEPYIPYYHVSRNYFETINVRNTRITNINYVTNNYYNVNNVHINNIRYVNQTVATTIVNNEVIIKSHRVDHNVYIDHDHDRHDSHDRWITNGPPVAPSHDSVLGRHAGEHASAPPARILNRRVAMKLPPPERPVPFENKRADLEEHHGRPLDSSEEDRLRRTMPHGRGDSNDDRGRQTQAGDYNRGPKQRDENPGAKDGDRTGYRGIPDRNNPSWDKSRRDDASAEHRVPRPSSRDNDRDDHGRQTSADGNYPGPKQREQNPGMKDDDKDQGRVGYRGIPQRNNPDSERSQRDDASAERRVPRPPQRNGNDRAHQEPSESYNPAPKQRDENPGAGDGERASRGSSAQQNSSEAQGSRHDDTSAEGHVPRPSRDTDDRDQQSSTGNSSPAPKQRDQDPNANDGGRASYTRGPQSPDSDQQRAQQHDDISAQRHVPRSPQVEAVRDPVPPSVRSDSPRVDAPQRYTPRAPMQSVEVMRERRGNSGSERPTAPQPSYSERAPSAPQQERTMMRQTQVDRGESHASQPAPRMAESQHSAPAESHVPPARDSGSNSNSRASSQEHDRGKSSDKGSDPK